MERRIEDATNVGGVPKEPRLKHKGFSQWDSYSSRHDHDTILQVNCFLFLSIFNSIEQCLGLVIVT